MCPARLQQFNQAHGTEWTRHMVQAVQAVQSEVPWLQHDANWRDSDFFPRSVWRSVWQFMLGARLSWSATLVRRHRRRKALLLSTGMRARSGRFCCAAVIWLKHDPFFQLPLSIRVCILQWVGDDNAAFKASEALGLATAFG